jgi:hypothetical protein
MNELAAGTSIPGHPPERKELDMVDWGQYNWKVTSFETGYGLDQNSTLQFVPQGTNGSNTPPTIQVVGGNPWGLSFNYTDPEGTVEYDSTPYLIKRGDGDYPYLYKLTCKPAQPLMLISPGSAGNRAGTGSYAGKHFKKRIAGLAGGIAVGTAVGCLLGCSFLAALATASTGAGVLWVAEQLIKEPDSDPVGGGDGSIWVAQGGAVPPGGGTPPNPGSQPA